MSTTITPTTSGQLRAGQTYPSKDGALVYTIVAVNRDDLLLELRNTRSGELSQYCVAHQPSFHDGFLVWQQGRYHLASPRYGNDPFLALCEAVDDMRRTKTLFVLTNKSSGGTTCSIHRTHDDAADALTKALARNLDMQIIAEKLGMQLSAKTYLDHKDAFERYCADDSYCIMEASTC